MRRRSWRRVAAACAALIATAATGCGGAGLGAAPGGATSERAPASASGSIPRDFIGVVAPDLMAGSRAYLERELGQQAQIGIGVVRQTFDWAHIEPRPGRWRFGAYDALVLAAAARGITILPVLFDPPAFESPAPAASPTRGARQAYGGFARATYPPLHNAAMAAFAAALVRRYGPGGTLWRTTRGRALPVRAWQVWNEPNLPVYWGGRPDPAGYARLLAAVSAAIHRADPRAEVVTAGMPNSKLGIPFSRYVERLYGAGAASAFDVLAVNAYATNDAGVISAVARTRAQMRAHGDAAKPLWITEVGWASGGPGSSFTVSGPAQARLVGRLIGELARRRTSLGIRGVIYYAWRDVRPYPGGQDFWGLHTGLLTLSGRPKPALSALASAIRRGG